MSIRRRLRPPARPSTSRSTKPAPHPATAPAVESAVGCSQAPAPSRRGQAFWRAGVVVGLSVALVAGVASEPPARATVPGGPAGLPTQQQDPTPGAPGFKAGLAPIFTPLTTINRAVTGGASPGGWNGNSSQGLPTDQPVGPSAQAPKPGLGTQDFYPLERRALGDRMELLVNLANGNVVVRNKDLAFAGTGLNTAVNHDYNNLATNRGSFGKRWTMTTGRDVGLDLSDPNKVVLQGPSGYRQDYTGNGNGGYTSPSGANAKLTKNSGGYELKFDKTKEKWNFDNNGFFTSQVDRNDNTITYQYASDGTLSSIKDTRGAVTTFEYDQAGRVTKMKDPTGYEYSGYSYDAQGQHTGFTDPSGKRVEYGYDNDGNLTSIKDPNGNEYRLEYDAQRRVTKVDEPREAGILTNDRAVFTYEYTSATETKGTNPAGGVTTYTFDNDGRQTKAKDPLGREESKTYTANSDVNTTTSIGGNVSTASFDPNNNLIGTKLPTGAQNAIGYTDGANPNAPTSQTDSEGRQTTMTYDGKGNPLTVKQAQTGQGIERTYNPNGTVKDSTDGKGNETTYSYDADGRLITVTPPAPRQPIRYTYDARSRLASVTDGNNTTLKYSYDAADRVVQLAQQTQVGDRPIQQTDFDANGNKTANYFETTTKQFSYSPRNQVMTDVRRGGLLAPTDTVTYSYDKTNNLASLKDAGGTTSYRYNTANDLTELTDIAGGVHRYQYDGDGNRNFFANPSGYGQTRAFDKSGRVTKINDYAKGAAVSTRTFDYTKAGGGDTELLQTLGEPNNSTTRYTYDGSSQLLRARNTNNSGGAVITDYAYTYDKAGNTTSYGGAGNFSYNAANELTNTSPTVLNYDGQGNNTGDNAGASITYTPTNQQNVKTTPDLRYTTKYDSADNTQIQRIDDRVAATGAQFSYELTQSALGETGRVRAGQGRYSVSRDPDGNPIAQRNPNGQMRYFELGDQGSVMGTQRADGTRGASFHYTPYGQYDVSTGPDASNADNFLGFQGGFFHGTFRNIHFGHRWYSAGVGRFNQPDPIGTPGSSGDGQDNRSGIGGPYSSEANAYTFASGNPCNNTDPSGLYTLTNDQKCAAGGVAFAIGVVGLGVLLAPAGIGLGIAAFGVGAAAAGVATCDQRFRDFVDSKAPKAY